MSKRKARTRRIRRTGKQRAKHGPKAAALHRGKSGRTGMMHTKKPKSRQRIIYVVAVASLQPRHEHFWIFEGLR